MTPRLKGTSLKGCRICGEQKPTMDFHKDRRFTGGHFPVCKKCFKEKPRG